VVSLDGGISSDWTELLATLGQARTAPVQDAMDALRNVVSGLTWQRPSPYRWMSTEGLVEHLSFEICDSMHQLAALAFAEGDLELTARALKAGLDIEPTSELLVRDLLLLRHRVDGVAGVLESYAELEEALGAVGGAEPSWATRALFDDLAGERA
jgi:DNA-binding SARP family transcriptional activator